MKITIQCKYCNGTGKQICTFCNGNRQNLHSIITFGFVNVCYNCGGSGKEICTHCAGTGKTYIP